LSQAHPLQLEAFAKALHKLDPGLPRPKLQLVGSCRNKGDEDRLQKLKELAVELKVENDVEFHKNIMYRYAIYAYLIGVGWGKSIPIQSVGYLVWI